MAAFDDLKAGVTALQTSVDALGQIPTPTSNTGTPDSALIPLTTQVAAIKTTVDAAVNRLTPVVPGLGTPPPTSGIPGVS